MTAAQPASSTRRTGRALWLCATLSLIGACSTTRDGDAPDTTVGAAIELGGGATLQWLADPPPSLEAVVEPAPSSPDEPGLTEAGSTIRLGPSGPVPTFRLRFDVGDAPVDDAVPVVGYTDGTSWSFLQPDWDAEAGQVTVVADHFSWWSAFWVRTGELIGGTLLDALGLIDQSPISCDSTLPAGWSIDIDGSVGGDLSWCAELEGTTLTIDIKNQRRSSFIVSLPDGWSGTLNGLAPLAETLSSWLFNSFGQSALVIPGGEVGRITVTGVQGNGNTVRLPIDQDMFAWAIDTMITAGLIYLGGSRVAGTPTDVSSLLKYLSDNDQVRGILECMGKTQEFADALAQPLSVDVLEQFLPAALECARAFAEAGVAGALNLLVGSVVGIVVSTWSILEMTIDLTAGTLSRTLVITSGPLVDATCTAELYDGSPAVVALGAGVACAEAQRIAAEYQQAPIQGSAAVADDLSDGWGCASPSAGEAATVDFVTACSTDDGRSFELKRPAG